MPIGWNACLPVVRVHRLQFSNGKFPNCWLDHRNNLRVFVEIWSIALQPNHIQGPGSLKGSVDMVILSRDLGFVQIG